MKLVLVALSALLACGGPGARSTSSPPAPTPIALWPGAAPDAQPLAGPENLTTLETDPLIAGRPWTARTNVARPTMTVYSPRGANTGVAVVVFPGGGYKELAIDLEGTEVCDWLTAEGITCVVLEYRVPFTGPYGDPACGCHITPTVPRALQDAQRAIGLLRARAAELGIDPHKLGVLGFSAGGHLVAAVSNHFDERAYPAVDAADRESSRPDFAIALYPGHLLTDDGFVLNPDIASHITARTPPTFLLQAEDDPVDDVGHSLIYYRGLEAAGVPTELHLYAHGGHAFGLRRTALPITRWPELVLAWLRTLGMLATE